MRISCFLVLSVCALAGCEGGVAGQTDSTPSASALESSLPDPSSGGDLLGWAKDEIVELLGNFSATNGSHFYRSPDDAYAAIAAALKAGGIDSPEDAIFVASVGKVRIEVFDWDHSELRILAAVGPKGQRVSLDLRTVGDVWGAGVYAGHITTPIGPELCLTYAELQSAIEASYLFGAYGVTFVCHTDTLEVLRAIGVAPEWYEPQVNGWKLARWAYGPLFGSGLSTSTAAWPPAARCVSRNIH